MSQIGSLSHATRAEINRTQICVCGLTIVARNKKGEEKMWKFNEIKMTFAVIEDGDFFLYQKEKIGIRIAKSARVGKSASVGEGARVGEWARVGEGARVGKGASVGKGARVGEWASVGEDARVKQNAQFQKSPLYIIGSRHIVYEFDNNVLGIGCETHSAHEWLMEYEKIGKMNNYTDEQIQEYWEYIVLYAKRCGEIVNDNQE